MERRPTYEELQAQVRRMAYLERLLRGGKRDKRAARGPTLFDAFFNGAADKLYPLYETLIDGILQSDDLQVDEVLWRIVDRPGQSCRMAMLGCSGTPAPKATAPTSIILRGRGNPTGAAEALQRDGADRWLQGVRLLRIASGSHTAVLHGAYPTQVHRSPKEPPRICREGTGVCLQAMAKSQKVCR